MQGEHLSSREQYVSLSFCQRSWKREKLGQPVRACSTTGVEAIILKTSFLVRRRNLFASSVLSEVDSPFIALRFFDIFLAGSGCLRFVMVRIDKSCPNQLWLLFNDNYFSHLAENTSVSTWVDRPYQRLIARSAWRRLLVYAGFCCLVGPLHWAFC